ncbi:MAG TPA: type II toxin-antitoxin system RelE/ParE family toxin [Gammaproteobacteria bacterium]|nr:type II toxin-antitoxin system RelE/ParE family toxin [Gammaproteobacteria bacterium]
MYELQIKRQAKKKLVSIPPRMRERIILKLDELAEDPDSPNLDIKKLINEPGYRLRVGAWRVIFERVESLQIIAIEKVGARGDVYK